MYIPSLCSFLISFTFCIFDNSCPSVPLSKNKNILEYKLFNKVRSIYGYYDICFII